MLKISCNTRFLNSFSNYNKKICFILFFNDLLKSKFWQNWILTIIWLFFSPVSFKYFVVIYKQITSSYLKFSLNVYFIIFKICLLFLSSLKAFEIWIFSSILFEKTFHWVRKLEKCYNYNVSRMFFNLKTLKRSIARFLEKWISLTWNSWRECGGRASY